MKLSIFGLLTLAVSCVVTLADPAVAPATAPDRAAAKAAFTSARELFSTDKAASAAGMKKAAQLDPNYFEAHQYYILYSEISAAPDGATDEQKAAASAKVVADITAEYTKLAADHPDVAGYQAALGTIYEYSNPDLAKSYFEKSVALDPKFGNGYEMLALCAEIRGQVDAARDFRKKAMEAEPDNADLWRSYVADFASSDEPKGEKIGFEMAKRFPDEAVSIMGYLAMRSHNDAQAQKLLERLHTEFPKSYTYAYPMLLSFYLKSDPAKAVSFAQEMIADFPENKQWVGCLAYAQAVAATDPLIAQGKAADALAGLNKITVPRGGPERRYLDLAKARATAAGEGGAAKAYADLLTIYIKTPSDEVHDALVGYGKSVGKDSASVDGEVFAARSAKAAAAVPFALVDYKTGKTVSLADYKGKPVLVNFWYPMCGPCRGEFPFLQEVLAKYQARGFTILAINGHAPEDHLVLPLLSGMKLDFEPLKGTKEIVSDYKVRGFPSNFLYGPDGRIFYTPGPVSTVSAQRELELQIEALLAKSTT